jgi:hypothetical protein
VPNSSFLNIKNLSIIVTVLGARGVYLTRDQINDSLSELNVVGNTVDGHVKRLDATTSNISFYTTKDVPKGHAMSRGLRLF